ncbi:MAG: M1 family metallopeptidase [Chitinophagaceae bacterium]|nr:M1 family metallopeptidase [Chitinophagaceae bacterium]
MKKTIIACLVLFPLCAFAQSNTVPIQGYWQQRIKYVMEVSLDVKTNKITGKQNISYTNNSPDTLNKIFIHLYWNAFQPNSMMDLSSRSTEGLVVGRSAGKEVTDFDRRFKRKIYELAPEEQGSCTVRKFRYNGKDQVMKQHETILEVSLDKKINPGATVNFQTEFEAQVPVLARRSGRDNPEGIRYSLGQWYPKVSEYDELGWHADQYIRGEFYGVWGDYNVNLTLDKNYKVGATGELQNASEIGWGYDKEGTPLKSIATETRTWKFAAKNVHDFVLAADPDYKHITRKTKNGPLLHFIYKNDPANEKNWQATADSCAMIYPFMAATFGPYPYPVYSFLQGGGGGTEYPTATLVKNHSFGTAVHEWCHSWYQMMLATDENLYGWFDEGFTSYAEARVTSWIRKTDFFASTDHYRSYFTLAKGPLDEPMSTPANFFSTNYAYNQNAYNKGYVFLKQLGYVVGEKNLDKILLDYYRVWRFRHPRPDDFIKVAEKTSGLQLQWYKHYMVNTTKTIDYRIDSLWEDNGRTSIRVRRDGAMPMPIDIQVTFKDSSREVHYIPLDLMLGEKPAEDDTPRKSYPSWKWTHETYVIETARRISDISLVEIDPTLRLADIERKNNRLKL